MPPPFFGGGFHLTITPPLRNAHDGEDVGKLENHQVERDDNTNPELPSWEVGVLKNLHDTSGVTKFWMIYQTFLFEDLFYIQIFFYYHPYLEKWSNLD